ncbi:hypothetical protein [Archangium lansingense]|uniref:Uncharacterized protein n=1 Tax=Archangium lansingense TaxID=2995310 RepID=A0ABT4ALR9_9BACT|nr:hypothetical protein [Archangium lansinium]MCY1081789.1 hypothetical protein [Archangium lansinium]
MTGPERAAQEDARLAEAEAALELVWDLAKGRREVGSRLVFTFWAHDGALTLLRYEEQSGRRAGLPANAEPLTRQLRPVFVDYLRGHIGEVVLTLTRAESNWTVDYDANSASTRPPEAKTLPVSRRGTPAQSLVKALEVATRVVRLMPVPPDGISSLRAEIMLVDDRIIHWEHRGFQVLEGEGSPRFLSQEAVERLARVLLPFTHGVGQRTVSLDLEGTQRKGEPIPRVQITEARILTPTPPYNEDPEFAVEYRALHEEILCRWREGVRDGAELLARYSVEELALWYVGGMLTRGAGLLFEAASPTVTRVLTRGGTEAAGWLRTALFRIPKAERAVFNNLWLKVQMEGAEALSRAEKNKLLLLMNRVEWLVRSPPEQGREGNTARCCPSLLQEVSGWAR